jgi:hypothetical protein
MVHLIILTFLLLGNCKNCQHPVNAHPRSNATQQPAITTASIVNAAVVTSDITKGQYLAASTEKFIHPPGSQQNPLRPLEAPYYPQPLLHSVPLDHSAAHIAQYDPKQGGYVTGTGTVTNNECTQGDYNNNGLTGPGVNNTVKSTGSVAYGGAYNSQYEGDYYSAKRVPEVPSVSAPTAQTVEVKVVSSSPAAGTSSGGGGGGEFDYDSVRAQYGNGYSAKRI